MKASKDTGWAAEEFNLEVLRDLERQRLLAALDAWETEKVRVEEAIARGEEKAKEFREVQEDVKRRLEALDLVANMRKEAGAKLPVKVDSQVSAEQVAASAAPAANTAAGPVPQKTAAANENTRETRVRSSWRPLFASATPAAAS